MTDLKTTVTGIVGALTFVVSRFGLDVPSEVTDGIIVITIAVIGYFARDSYKPSVKVDVNPSILPERDRTAEIRKRVSDKTKLERID